jgi:hypothetical protein
VVMRSEQSDYSDRFLADRLHVRLWARGRLFQLAPFVFSDEDFGIDGDLFKQFNMDLGNKVGIGLCKDKVMQQRGTQRRSEKELYIEKLWSYSSKDIRHTLAQRRSAVGSMIRKSYLGKCIQYKNYLEYAMECLTNILLLCYRPMFHVFRKGTSNAVC